jgi:hypothetical protein
MLTTDERALLDHTIEMLDRLYDRDSTVAEVLRVLVATSAVRGRTELYAAFEDAVLRLREVEALDASPERKRGLGCDATNHLRKLVADELRCDVKENPRQRRELDQASGRGGPTG